MKRIIKTPYQRLLEDITKFCGKLRYRHTVVMWVYPKNRLNESWRLGDVYERVCAAEQIGYDVLLQAKDDGLHVVYKKKAPDVPYEWR